MYCRNRYITHNNIFQLPNYYLDTNGDKQNYWKIIKYFATYKITRKQKEGKIIFLNKQQVKDE